MRVFSLFAIISVSSLSMSGCNIIDAIYSSSLNEDAKKLLKDFNIEVESLSCQAEIDSRTGFCRYTTTPEQNKKLVERVKLQEFRIPKRSLEDLENDSSISKKNFQNELENITIFSSVKKDSCWNTLAAEKVPQVQVYLDLNGKLPNLYLPDGRRFDKFSVIYSQPEKKGCFQVNYAYG
jgi:hypothetical protein